MFRPQRPLAIDRGAQRIVGGGERGLGPASPIALKRTPW